MRKLTVLALTMALAMVLVVSAGALAQNGGNRGGNGGGNGGGGNGGGGNGGGGNGGGDEGAVIIGRGSDTTYNVSLQLASLYNGAPELGAEGINPDGDIVLNAQPEGSSVGIQNLAEFAAGEDEALATAFARSSRGPNPDDPGGLTFTSFARDGIVPVTLGADEGGPAENVDNLTLDQLRGIFVTCEITDFGQIGGTPGVAIEPYTLQAGSGTRAVFDRFLGGDSESCLTDPDNVVFENSLNPFGEEEFEPEDRDRVIIPFSFARFSTSVPFAGAEAIAVNGVEADPDTISTRQYRLNRLVYFVTLADNSLGDEEANEAADDFVNFVCRRGPVEDTENPITGNSFGEDVDNVIEANGFGLVRRCNSTTTEEPTNGGEPTAGETTAS